jgi:GT2 family glycosyltransferase
MPIDFSIHESLPEPVRQVLRRARAAVLSLGLPKPKDFVQPEGEAKASSQVSVVVAICDSPRVVRRCLASLEKYAAQAEVILVDDGSKLPETIGMLRGFRDRNQWRFIRHERSCGHSRSCEAGARQATRPILCLLNSDTMVTPWSWQGIIEAFESDPNIVVAGPSTSWASTAQMMQRAMHCRHFWTESQINGYAAQIVVSGRRQLPVDLPEASGCAFFIRKKVWEQAGGFDENLPDYGNESELCMRLRERGWRIVWAPSSYIHHFGRQSYGREDEKRLLSMWQAARSYIDEKHAHLKS